MGFARKSRRASVDDKAETSITNTMELDKRVQLKDRPCSDDDEELEYDGENEDEDN